MEANCFDAWTCRLTASRHRRAVLRTLAAGSLAAVAALDASGSPATARCRRTSATCRKSRQCCGSRRCVEGACCPRQDIFVDCPAAKFCAHDPALCCATEEVAPSFCCPPEMVCGGHCCNPSFEGCIAGACACILPDPNDCPSGSGGGLYRVRRF